MNALELAQTAYGTAAAPTRTDRGAEYEVIARITRRMKAAADEGRRGFPALAAALHDNLQLWTIFAADVAAPDNRLPADLRARIFYLFEFTQQHTPKVMASGDGADAAVLVDINTAVMRGLRGGGTG